MANLVSNEYYEYTWLGTIAKDENELTVMLSRAEDLIRMSATRLITEYNINDWVKKAICVQTEYLINGAKEIMDGSKTPVDSWSLKDYSETKSKGGVNASGTLGQVISDIAIGYLAAGGFRSCIVHGYSY